MNTYWLTLAAVAQRLGIVARDVTGSLCDGCGYAMDMLHGRQVCHRCGFTDGPD